MRAKQEIQKIINSKQKQKKLFLTEDKESKFYNVKMLKRY